MTTSVITRSAPVLQEEPISSEHGENVLLPDLFISFQAEQLRLHPKYQEVKAESESWMAEQVVRKEIVDWQANGSDLVSVTMMRQPTESMLKQTFRTSQHCGRMTLNSRSFEPSATG